MKIALLSPNYPPMPWPCGAAHFIRQYASNLAMSGHDVSVITSNLKSEAQLSPFQVKIVPGRWDLRYLKNLNSFFEREKYDIVDFQYESAMYGARAIPLMLPFTLKGRSFPLVLTLHSQALPRYGGKIWRPLQIWAFDGAFFYSQAFFERTKGHFPRSAHKMAMHGFPANIIQSVTSEWQGLIARFKAGQRGSKHLLLYFGNINPGRGLESLIESIEQLKAFGHFPRLMLIGKFNPVDNDYHYSLLDLIQRKGLKEQISFSGELADDAVSNLLYAADICLLPFVDGASFKNGSLAAAIEHCLPTITTISGLTEDALKNNSGIKTYISGDTNRLTLLMDDWLKNPAQLVNARKALEPLRDQISWNSYIKSRLDFYQSALHQFAGKELPLAQNSKESRSDRHSA